MRRRVYPFFDQFEVTFPVISLCRFSRRVGYLAARWGTSSIPDRSGRITQTTR